MLRKIKFVQNCIHEYYIYELYICESIIVVFHGCNKLNQNIFYLKILLQVLLIYNMIYNILRFLIYLNVREESTIICHK